MNTTLLELLRKSNEVKLVIDDVVLAFAIKQLSPSASSTTPQTSAPNAFRIENGRWKIRFNGHEIQRRRSVALTYVHALLKNPYGSISPTELLAAHYGENSKSKSEREFKEEGHTELELSTQGDFGEPVVSHAGRRRILAALRELKGELTELKDAGETQLAYEKAEEVEKLEEYLDKTRFHGHGSRFCNRADRDRKSVSMAIARAINDLAQDHPALARHLDNSIRTGKECTYVPETEVKWIL